MARGALERGFARLAERQAAAERVAVEQPGGQALRAPRVAAAARRALGQLDQALLRVVHEPGARHRARDQPQLLRAARVERASGQDQVERAREPDQSRQPRGAAKAGKDAEQGLGQADLGARLLSRDARVARQRQLGAAAQTHAVDRGHGRVREGGEPVEGAVRELDELEHPVAVGDRADRLEVGPGDERSALAAGQDHPRGLEPLDLDQRHVEIGERRLIEHVDGAGGVVEDQGHRSSLGGLDAERPHASRSTMKAAPWPPPTHSEAMPRRALRRRISISIVSSSRAPLAPTG